MNGNKGGFQFDLAAARLPENAEILDARICEAGLNQDVKDEVEGWLTKAGSNLKLAGLKAVDTPQAQLVVEWVDNTSTVYYLKDHLGSVRAAVNESGDVVSYDDYDPWGLTLAGRSMTSQPNLPNKFTGKERDTDFGLDWDYFGARFYDPAIARWMVVDPRDSDYPSLSPYNYAANNPLYYKDPDGEGLIGAIIGGAAGGYYAYTRTKELLGGNTQGRGWDVFKAVVAGSGAGAIAGGLDVTEGAGVLLGGVAAGVGEAAAQYFATGEVSDWGQVGLSTAFGVAGAGIGKVLFKQLPVAKSLAGDQLNKLKSLADIFQAGPVSFGENVVGSVGATEFINWAIKNGYIQVDSDGNVTVTGPEQENNQEAQKKEEEQKEEEKENN